MNNNNNLTSIEKAILILRFLSKEPYKYKVSTISSSLGLNRTTVYRTLDILEKTNMVIKTIDESNIEIYMLGPEVYHIGMQYLHNKNYYTGIYDILNEISNITKESVGMAIKEGDKIISLCEIEVHQPMKFNDVPGRYFPVNKGNYGKCLMAYQSDDYIEKYLNNFFNNSSFEKTTPYTITEKSELIKEYNKIKSNGYSLSIDELAMDVIGVGIPIFNKKNEISACVAVAFYRSEGWQEKLTSLKKVLFNYQEELGKLMP